ncbi:hypothetical protein [Maribacter sp. 2210JD10-5]|uniref:hypothetical protein n=1 Tax=Maribacter sp. 2210JD10-5 TaxID=3386272 RepID=UPI0039BCCE9A
MKPRLSFLLIISLFLFLTAQSQETYEKGWGIVNLERHQVKFGTGFNYELGLFKNVTIGTGFGPSLVSYSEGYTTGLAWHTQLKYYTNLNSRKIKGKNISGNSGDYIAAQRSVFWGPLQLSTDLRPPKDFAVAFYGMVYGVQRTNKKGFQTNVEMGGGIIRGDGAPNGYGGLLSVSFGWLATKPKNKKPKIKWQN